MKIESTLKKVLFVTLVISSYVLLDSHPICAEPKSSSKVKVWKVRFPERREEPASSFTEELVPTFPPAKKMFTSVKPNEVFCTVRLENRRLFFPLVGGEERSIPVSSITSLVRETRYDHPVPRAMKQAVDNLPYVISETGIGGLIGFGLVETVMLPFRKLKVHYHVARIQAMGEDGELSLAFELSSRDSRSFLSALSRESGLEWTEFNPESREVKREAATIRFHRVVAVGNTFFFPGEYVVLFAQSGSVGIAYIFPPGDVSFANTLAVVNVKSVELSEPGPPCAIVNQDSDGSYRLAEVRLGAKAIHFPRQATRPDSGAFTNFSWMVSIN